MTNGSLCYKKNSIKISMDEDGDLEPAVGVGIPGREADGPRPVAPQRAIGSTSSCFAPSTRAITGRCPDDCQWLSQNPRTTFAALPGVTENR